MIDPTEPFVLYAVCDVEYDGRAYSTLERGRYLIIYKNDGSFLIHASDLSVPRNYQGAGSVLEYHDNKITCTNKKECIIVRIYDIINYISLPEWSAARIKISRTEKDLVQKIYANWERYFGYGFEIVYAEHQTKLGAVDLLGVTHDGVRHVVEVKRGKATIRDCSQLYRYIESFRDNGHEAIGTIASPAIGKNASTYLEKHGCHWLYVDFD